MFLLSAREPLLCALLLAPAGVWAEEQWVSAGAPLGLQEAVARTLQSNPDLKAFGYELAAQNGRTLQAGFSPNPELVIDVEDVFGSGSRSGVSAAQTTISLRQVLERSGLQARIAAAQAGRAMLDAELVEKRLDAAAEAARRFARVLSDQARLEVTLDAIKLAEQTVGVVRLRVNAAKSPDAELARAEAALARAKLEHDDVEHELLTRKRQLAAMWGETEPKFGAVLGDLTRLPDLEPYSELTARIKANPSLMKYSTEAQLREAELRLAEQRRKPAWQISAGIRRFEAEDDFAGVAGIAIPLPWNDRGQGNVATAQARLDQVDASRSAAEVRLLTHLFELFQELAHARHVALTLDAQVLPRIVEALKQTEYAYERGRYSYIDLVLAQRELLDTQRARIQAAVDVYGYATEIDRLTGMVPGASPAAPAVAAPNK